jgi:hypothetical protein
MNFSELAVGAVVSLGPLYLAGRAWRRYLQLEASSVQPRFQMRTGLFLLSVSVIMWLAVVAVMFFFFQEYNRLAWSIARKMPPGEVGVINLLLCVITLVCAGARRRSAQATIPL